MLHPFTGKQLKGERQRWRLTLALKEKVINYGDDPMAIPHTLANRQNEKNSLINSR
jgi:hypothetical protein